MIRHSLAGTNGIPAPSSRTYLHVVAEVTEAGKERPLEIIWPDGRRFRVTSSRELRSFGRWEFGTLVVAYEVTLKRRCGSDARRTVWWERGRWFTQARPGPQARQTAKRQAPSPGRRDGYEAGSAPERSPRKSGAPRPCRQPGRTIRRACG